MAPGGDDRWLPLGWDRFNWSDSVRPPAGHVVRTDPEGQRWEIVCGGLRNPFGLAFNSEGEMFTYDADIEWDVGLPWYRPTRVLHLVSGADYGWRGGSRALPALDARPLRPPPSTSAKDRRRRIAFGSRSRFPARWRQALVYSGLGVRGDLRDRSAAARRELRADGRPVFLQGRPLNVTGLDFGPDGALYFVTGGRRTRRRCIA